MADAGKNPSTEVQRELPFDSVILVPYSELVPAIQRTQHPSIQVSLDKLAQQGYFVEKKKAT